MIIWKKICLFYILVDNPTSGLIDWLIDNCLTSSEQYFSYIQNANQI